MGHANYYAAANHEAASKFVGQERLAAKYLAGERVERLGPNEPLRARGHERDHLVALLHKQPRHFARLVGGNAPGDAKKDSAHALIVPPKRQARRLLLVFVRDLALGDFLEGERQVVLRARLDQWRRELVERPLTELVVVVVDLARALGSDDHECVA